MSLCNQAQIKIIIDTLDKNLDHSDRQPEVTGGCQDQYLKFIKTRGTARPFSQPSSPTAGSLEGVCLVLQEAETKTWLNKCSRILLGKSPVREKGKEPGKAGWIIRLQCKSDSRWKTDESSILDYHAAKEIFNKLLESPQAKISHQGVLVFQERACLRIPNTLSPWLGAAHEKHSLRENTGNAFQQLGPLVNEAHCSCTSLRPILTGPAQGRLSGAFT